MERPRFRRKVRFATSEHIKILEAPNILDGRRRNLI
jgi:hypothetical protein